MSEIREEIKPHHLRALASDIEDCHDPQSWADYCRAAAAMLEIKDARIAELEAALRAIVNICLVTCLRPGIEAQKMQSIAMAVLTKCNCAGQCNQYGECISKARAALEGGKL